MFLVRREIIGRRLFSTASPLKTLRDLTGAPLIDCKNALAASGGDIEKAKAWISERSKAVASKISGRATKQGLVGMSVTDSTGALVEVNCETDFVARGDDFQSLVRERTAAVANGKDISPESVTKVVGRVRENIVLGGALRLGCPTGGVLGSYLHNSIGNGVGTAGVVVAISNPGSDAEKARALARAIAVQIMGTKPAYISRDQVPAQNRKEEEEKILKESADILRGKPEKAKEGLLRGKMQKYYSDLCLMEQPFILGEFEGKLVKDVLPKEAKVQGFIRMSVGGDTGSSNLQ